MSRSETLFCVGMLFVLGAGWGMTMPLTKIAVSTGYKHFGLLFWQMAIGVMVMSSIALVRGTRLPLGVAQLRVYVLIALIGSVLPNTASYQAAVHLPAGVLSILLSMIPIWAFPIALMLGLDRFEWIRLGGLAAGLSAVLLIVLPGADMSGSIPIFWVLIGIALPLALGSGQWIDPRMSYGPVELALVASSTLHVLTYTGYVWLVGRAGPVFTVQISYLVTLFGILWAWLILSEAYPPVIWAALALMLVGMYLVQPRAKPALDDGSAIRDTGT